MSGALESELREILRIFFFFGAGKKLIWIQVLKKTKKQVNLKPEFLSLVFAMYQEQRNLNPAENLRDISLVQSMDPKYKNRKKEQKTLPGHVPQHLLSTSRSLSSRKKSAPFAADIKAFGLLAQCTTRLWGPGGCCCRNSSNKKKSSGDVRRKEGDQRRGNNVANASVGRKIGARRIRVGGLGAWRWREESFIFLNSKKERWSWSSWSLTWAMSSSLQILRWALLLLLHMCLSVLSLEFCWGLELLTRSASTWQDVDLLHATYFHSHMRIGIFLLGFLVANSSEEIGARIWKISPIGILLCSLGRFVFLCNLLKLMALSTQSITEYSQKACKTGVLFLGGMICEISPPTSHKP
jgi:hypothetical protein